MKYLCLVYREEKSFDAFSSQQRHFPATRFGSIEVRPMKEHAHEKVEEVYNSESRPVLTSIS